MPTDKRKWEEYFLEVYDYTLSSLLDKQKVSYDKEHSKGLYVCNMEVVQLYFKKLMNVLHNTSMTQEEITKELVPCNSPIITLIRSGIKNVT